MLELDPVPSFTEQIEADAAEVAAGRPGCGHTCPGCHGALTCIRATHNDTVPHVGRDNTGQLVQWLGCDDDTHAAARASAEQAKVDNAQRTRDLLAGLDPDVLREFLGGASP